MRCVIRGDVHPAASNGALGERRRRVIYVPGIDGSGELLLGLASKIAERRRLTRLAYTCDSPIEEDQYSGLARRLWQVVDGSPGDKVVLLAESFGGAVALQAVLEKPERVAGLVLVNSFAHYRARARLQWSRWILPRIPPPVFQWARARFAPRTLFGKLRDADAIARFRKTRHPFSPEGYARRLRMIQRLDLRERLPEVSCPTLVVAGDRDRVVDSVRQAELMNETIPLSRAHVVEGGGHLLLPITSLPWIDWLDSVS